MKKKLKNEGISFCLKRDHFWFQEISSEPTNYWNFQWRSPVHIGIRTICCCGLRDFGLPGTCFSYKAVLTSKLGAVEVAVVVLGGRVLFKVDEKYLHSANL